MYAISILLSCQLILNPRSHHKERNKGNDAAKQKIRQRRRVGREGARGDEGEEYHSSREQFDNADVCVFLRVCFQAHAVRERQARVNVNGAIKWLSDGKEGLNEVWCIKARRRTRRRRKMAKV